MHVCFAAIDYHGASAGGGIASYVDTLGRELLARGHRVTVLASGPEPSVSDHDGLRVLQAPLGNLHWYLHKLHAPSVGVLPVRELEWSRSLRRLLDAAGEEHPIDIVEGQETGGLFMTDELHPPLVVRFHGDAYVFGKHSGEGVSLGARLDRRLQRRAWERASAVTAPSAVHAGEMESALGWPAGRVKVVPNPINPWMLENAIAGGPSLDASPGTILYVGRIQRAKGFLPLLASVQHVLPHAHNARYVIAGGRHVSIDDRTLSDALPHGTTRSRVELLGHVPWRELPSLYRQAEVFVMPSYYETFGISAAEAMAFGLPVVATLTGGLPEIVLDGVTGLLVPPGDHLALAEALCSLLQDHQRARRMGRAGRERALAEFAPERATNMTLSLYQDVLARGAPRGES